MSRIVVIKRGVVLLVLFALTIWVVSRWDVWFGNPPEPSYSVMQSPSRILMTNGELPNHRTITWQHDSIIQSACVEYADVSPSLYDILHVAKANAVTFESRSGKSTFYRANMTELKEGGDYKYRICSGIDTTQWFEFSMPKSDSLFSFLFFGDVQDELNGSFDSLFHQAMLKNRDRAFVLFAGDLIERPMDKYWAEVFRSFDTLSATCPILSVPGNHEYLKGVTRRLEGRFPLVFPYFFQDTLRMKEFGVLDNSLYTFSRGDAQFFFLDSNRDFWNYFAQRTWLKNELRKSDKKWKVVVLHHPVHSVKGFFNGLMVRLFFEDVLEDYNVDVVLQGHEHVYARSSSTTTNELKEPLYLVTYSSQKDYPMKFYGDVAKWGTADRYYQKFEVSFDSIVMNTYTSSHELYDKVVLIKDDSGKLVMKDLGRDIPQRIEVSDWFRANKREKRVKEFEESIEKWKKSQE